MVIIGLVNGFSVCLVYVGVLFLCYSFLSRFSESVVSVLPLLLTCLVGMFKTECLLKLKARRGGGD